MNPLTVVLLVVASIAVVQTALLVWMLRRLGRLRRADERVSRLTDGLALLTDTTEAGLTTLIREVEQLGRRQVVPRAAGSRASVARRVVAAARKGERLTHIAESESLSEGEVRLHLSLADSDVLKGLRDAAMRS